MKKTKTTVLSSGNAPISTHASKIREHYSHAKADARKDKRSAEAHARQLKYDDMTIKQQMTLAKSRPGESKKELAKLTAKLAAAKMPAPTPIPVSVPAESPKKEKLTKKKKSV